VKRGGAAVLVLIGLVVAFFAFGGQAEGPSETPDVALPDTDETTSKVVDFFDNIADAVSGWNENTWRVITVGIFALILWRVFKAVPLWVWLVFALIGAVIAVQM